MPTILNGTCGAGLHEHRGARFAEAAVDAVFFDGDDCAAIIRGI